MWRAVWMTPDSDLSCDSPGSPACPEGRCAYGRYALHEVGAAHDPTDHPFSGVRSKLAVPGPGWLQSCSAEVVGCSCSPRSPSERRCSGGLFDRRGSHAAWQRPGRAPAFPLKCGRDHVQSQPDPWEGLLGFVKGTTREAQAWGDHKLTVTLAAHPPSCAPVPSPPAQPRTVR